MSCGNQPSYDNEGCNNFNYLPHCNSVNVLNLNDDLSALWMHNPNGQKVWMDEIVIPMRIKNGVYFSFGFLFKEQKYILLTKINMN